MSFAGFLLAGFLALCAVGITLSAIIDERCIPAALAWVGSVASLAAIWIGWSALLTGGVYQIRLWEIRSLATLSLSVDRLSGLFIATAGLVFLTVSVFSAQYLRHYVGRYSLRTFGVFFFGLFASVVGLLIAGDALLFLFAWEAMSIFSYLLVNYEHERDETVKAGYLMLAFGEAGTVAVALAFLLLANNGALDFASLKAGASQLSAGVCWAVFALSFFGFGVKAGLIPVNAWLPRAHPLAPANVSALLSGTLLNLGIYGILRLNFDLAPATMPGMGLVVLVVGSLTALLGILYATTQNDLKALLAHSSAENIGIITAALGASLVFLGSGHPAVASIALVAALYHMVNHSLYKTLLFLGAGTIDLQTGTRNLDRLGGLIKWMPWTALLFLVGTLSIAALPPFNGFVSEWLTLQTLLLSAELASTGAKIVFALCGAGLALTAALAVTCFVKAFAMGFLGMSRSEEARQAREPGASVKAPMALLAVLCLILGVTPTYVIPILDRAVAPMTHAYAADALVPPFFAGNPHHNELPPQFAADFHNLGAQLGQSALPGRGLVVMHRGGKANPVVFAMSTSYMAIVLALMLLGTYVVFRLIIARSRAVERRVVWDGGIRRLLPEMTYTGTGFSNPVRVIFEAVFRPTTVEDTRETVGKHFRAAIRRTRGENHVLDRLVLNPIADGALWVSNGFARMHHGFLNAYVFYGLGALIVALLIARFS
ncbi:MAG: proton-conducting transporter membrane subunit [Candidatus Binataceae bacterium]